MFICSRRTGDNDTLLSPVLKYMGQRRVVLASQCCKANHPKIGALTNDSISSAHICALWEEFGRNNSLLFNCVSAGTSLKLGVGMI